MKKTNEVRLLGFGMLWGERDEGEDMCLVRISGFWFGRLVLVSVAGKCMRISRFQGKFSLGYVPFEVPQVQPGGEFQ